MLEPFTGEEVLGAPEQAELEDEFELDWPQFTPATPPSPPSPP